MRRLSGLLLGSLPLLLAGPAPGQVDETVAAAYFEEAAALCSAEGGRLWGVSLCGPMVFADPATRSIAANRPTPDAPRPRALGYANAAMAWGGERWATFIWPMVPRDPEARARLMGVAPIPGAGTVYPSYRVTAAWGSLEADEVLVSPDGSTLAVPAEFERDGRRLTGGGWILTLAPGWTLSAGDRPGDLRVEAPVVAEDQIPPGG